MAALPARLAERFRIERKLGQGAIAEVWLAEDESTGRRVALKVLYPALRENPVVVERFRREVELARKIADRHVLSIADVIDRDGHLFLVMEHHPGGDLADRLANLGPLGNDALLLLARQLTGALGAAHRAGIVHRDVKPSNILVGPGPTLDLRLCDFGLARSAEGGGLTTSAAVLGTPEYMAPEVIAEGYADPRSDIYSLGVVLYEAATGRLPFVADSPYQLMRLHLEVDPPAPRSLVPTLGASIDAAITRALAKDPLERFETAEELWQAIAEPVRATALAKTLPRTGCPHCGGWLVPSVGICADCGHAPLRLDHEKGGVSVVVTGPGGSGDKVEAKLHVALHRLAAELPPEGFSTKRLRATAPRYPFVLARELTRSSAEQLLARLEAIGFTGRVQEGRLSRAPDLRKKARTMAGRAAAAAGAGAWTINVGNVLPKEVFGSLGRFGMVLLLGMAMPGIAALVVAARSGRPLLERPRKAPAPRTLERLARAFAGLKTRQDRRLLGRICERLTEAQAARAALVEHGVALAEGLLALEAAHDASATAGEDAGTAQSELRKLERRRVLVRAQLLRLSAHLDRAALADAAAGVAAASGVATEAGAELAHFAIDLEAARELEAYLRRSEGAARDA
jgi:tRNA A-37 threonylcarbamoyl transferase component Bud32